MLRVVAWVALSVLLALPQGTMVKAVRAQSLAGVSQRTSDGSAPVQRGAAEPVELGDDGDDGDDDDAVSAGAVLAAQLAPETPRSAVARPTSTRAGVLWSLAIQECGPPRA